MPRAAALDVFYGTEPMGTVHDTTPLGFEYAPTWLQRADAFALCAIGLAPGRIDSPEVHAFFENLLPEGDLRAYMAQQRKASIALLDGPEPWLPQGAAPSTHILKPDIRRLPKVRDSAANEAIVMRAAHHCGLNVAPVFYEPTTRACIVERFDRVRQPDGSLRRLVQYDFCQLSGLGSERKYEKEGGPSLAACAALVRRYSARPALDLQALAQWVLFNLYVGNNDSHAKNLSIYHRPGEGVRLTPFYDLMCTRIYPGLSDEFAFSLGGETRPGQFGGEHLEALAAQLGMGARYVRGMAGELAARVPEALNLGLEEVMPFLPASGQGLADRLAMKVKSITRRTVERFR